MKLRLFFVEFKYNFSVSVSLKKIVMEPITGTHVQALTIGALNFLRIALDYNFKQIVNT